MKTKIILATIAATAIASTAMAKPMHHRASHAAGASSGSDATKALNEKSLAQASGGGMSSPMAPRSGAMSDSGASAPMATPDAAPMGSPANTMTPPATPAPPQ